ncbi:MAG: hypothetical protein K2W84_02375 [Burkholderiales bacterium]|nr:hypothetical protein [Burkholderiales bacterium]
MTTGPRIHIQMRPQAGLLERIVFSIIALLLVVAAFFFIGIAIIAGLALAAVLAARWWWLGRKLRKAQQAEQADVVEGEYRVVGAEVIEAAVIEQPPQRRE